MQISESQMHAKHNIKYFPVSYGRHFTLPEQGTSDKSSALSTHQERGMSEGGIPEREVHALVVKIDLQKM